MTPAKNWARWAPGQTVAEIAAEFGVSRPTIYRHL